MILVNRIVSRFDGTGRRRERVLAVTGTTKDADLCYTAVTYGKTYSFIYELHFYKIDKKSCFNSLLYNDLFVDTNNSNVQSFKTYVNFTDYEY